MRNFAIVVSAILLAACSKPPSSPAADSPDTIHEEPPDTDDENVERPGLTAAECEAQGGKLVGDIGDGAIHRPDYRCPESGEAPIGTIVADPEGPVAIEGAVCCG